MYAFTDIVNVYEELKKLLMYADTDTVNVCWVQQNDDTMTSIDFMVKVFSLDKFTNTFVNINTSTLREDNNDLFNI